MSSTSTPSTLGSFLALAKKNFSGNKTQPITFVIGNQSADLDSFTSSTLYAFLRSHSQSPPKLSDIYVPVLNIPAADVDIRPEFHALFKHANINPKDLVTLDDFGPTDASSLAQRLPPAATNWVLTDHNKLEGPLGAVYGPRVRGVIDHHEDEHAVPADTAPEPRVVQPCGSCTTLVVREMTRTWEALTEGPSATLAPDEAARVAKFALASILIDTRNLTSVDKTTPADEDVAGYLRAKIKQSVGGSYDTTALFAELKAAKNDVSGMDAQGVFRKDYKAWTEDGLVLGTSSAVKRLNKLAKKVGKEHEKDADAWAKAANEFMQSKGADLWLVLTSFNDDEGVHRRELALHWARPELRWVAEEFERQWGSEMKLERSEVEKLPCVWQDNGPGRQTWLQMNGAMSRKQVAPALRRVISGGPQGKQKI